MKTYIEMTQKQLDTFTKDAISLLNMPDELDALLTTLRAGVANRENIEYTFGIKNREECIEWHMTLQRVKDQIDWLLADSLKELDKQHPEAMRDLEEEEAEEQSLLS